MGAEDPGFSPSEQRIEAGVARRLDAIDAERHALLEGPVADARLALAQDLDDAMAFRARLAALVEAVEASFGIPARE